MDKYCTIVSPTTTHTFSVPGLSCTTSFISKGEETDLQKNLQTCTFEHPFPRGRSVLHFGYTYNYTRRSLSAALPFPSFLDAIVEKLPFVPDQCIVNRYESGHGIHEHIDHPTLFGERVCIVSLGSAVIMTFRCNGAVENINVPPRSLLTMENDARYEWTHEIAARTFDIISGKRRARAPRTSLTFRTVSNT